MNQKTRMRRLDEILLEQGLITEEQIREALLRQKARGGRFGSQLIYHRFIDEKALVKALEIQRGVPGIVLSEYDIPDILCRMIPQKVALSRKVVPFDYDTENNILKVACQDPTDQDLIHEINFVAGGKKVEYFVAAEIALNTALSKYYLKQDISLDDSLLIDLPDCLTETDEIITPETADKTAPATPAQSSILLITDEIFSSQHVQSLFERDKYLVFTAGTLKQAATMIEEQKFHAVFIKNTTNGDHAAIVDRVRRLSPKTIVRYYDRITSLLLHDPTENSENTIIRKNNELVTNLLSSRAGLTSNHSARVGMYVEKLCQRLEIPHAEKLLITNAAYLHDFARYYYSLFDETSNRRLVQLTTKLLYSMDYPPQIPAILASMYSDLDQKSQKNLPLETLGGNILTMVELFCDSLSEGEKLTLEKFGIIKRRLSSLKGHLFLPEITDVFTDMIQEEVLDRHTVAGNGQVLIYAKDPEKQHLLGMRLKNEGFGVILATSSEEIIKLHQRRNPDLMIFAIADNSYGFRAMMDKCRTEGIDFYKIPCFVLMNVDDISNQIDLLEKGIEDIVGYDDNPDILITKMRRLMALRFAANGQKDAHNENQTGTRGRLTEMNLVDLIQALGPGLKTVKISVKPASDDKTELLIYIKKGKICYAAMGDTEGPEAIYEGLTWADGNWVIQPVSPENIPPPNNSMSNESILMEGCRRLDEKVKSGKLL